MAKGSEKTTDALVAEKLPSLKDYPVKPNVETNGIIWFVGDSYKDTNYKWLAEKFKYASKSQSGKDRGTPDFMVVKQSKNTIVVIENKRETDKHSRFDDVQDYKQYGYGNAKETQNYAIDGALWYATFLNSEYDVVAVAVSGDRVEASKVTSFVLPKNGKLADIELLEDLTIKECLVSIDDYITTFNRRLGRDKTDEDIKRLLRRYTLSCANFLRANGIEDNDKAGFVSALILALTNKQSTLYKMIKRDVDCARLIASKKIQKRDIDNIDDSLGNDAIDIIKDALYGQGTKGRFGYINGVFDIDGIPEGKRISLKKYYNRLLDIDDLLTTPRERNDAFKFGNNVLSACLYSLFLNVTELLDNRTSIDIMGEFYTIFLRFTKGNAKEKGIVLTPKHITDLFCDIAEHFGGKLTERTKIIDICCGTGAFLISALNRIKTNIYKSNIADSQKEKRYKKAQENSLIGIENNSSMYSLAYANMRFHGDGKSNLFNCSCLLLDSYANKDGKGVTYNKSGEEIRLADALKEYGDIDFAFINPPYSLDKKKSSENVSYPMNLNEILGVPEGDDTVKEILIQKGLNELDFVASMLYYLKEGGIGIAIVPMSCAGSSGSYLRAEILKYHTLLACMTMPAQLFFDSHIGQTTCIMVFKAHIPHDNNKSVFFGRWKEDGFKVIPHNGRKDSGQWQSIKNEWINQIDGTANIDDTVWLRHKINSQGEALPEAYVKTDFSQINDEIFKGVVRQYSLYKYMEENSALEVKDSEKMSWLLDNYNDFEKKYSGIKKNSDVKLSDRKWERFKLQNIINKIDNGKSYNASDLTVSDSDEYILYITRTDNNNGVSMCVVDEEYSGREKKDAITIGDTTATIFYQNKDFVTGPHMIVVRADWFNVYTAHFLIAVLNLEKYRYPVFGRAFLKDLVKETEIELPIDKDGEVDYEFMEDYIKSLPFSCNL